MGKREIALENLKKTKTPEAIAKCTASRRANKALKTQIYEELKNDLVKNGKNGSYYQEFLDKFLNMAKKDPNSRCGQMVASTIFQQDMLNLLDEEHNKEMARDLDFQRYRIAKELFKEQRELLYEINHSRIILACCSRRAGKTDAASACIDYASIIPNSRIIYINLTFTNAINQIWNNVVDRAAKSGLEIKSSSKSEGTIEFSNGSSLRIAGNSNNAEIDKLRGETKVSLLIIDEFFHQRNMQYALDEVISPFMADRQDSTILCMGTPPRISKTYGEKCWNEKGIKKFHWTMFDNPYMPGAREYIEEFCKNKGITEDSPFVQREFYGKIGVYDTEALVFRGRQTYNIYDKQTPITDIAIGVDYGFSDYNSIITVAYNVKTKRSWVVKESKFNKACVSEIIDKIKEHFEFASDLCKTNRVMPLDHIKIFADTNEESITKDLMIKHKLPAFNCYKFEKAYAIEMLAQELRTGRMQIPHNGILDEEMEQILYKRDEDSDAIIPELDEVIGIHADAMMALLYASRRIFFDFDYDISYIETHPERKSSYITDENGTIIGYSEEGSESFQDSGIVG